MSGLGRVSESTAGQVKKGPTRIDQVHPIFLAECNQGRLFFRDHDCCRIGQEAASERQGGSE